MSAEKIVYGAAMTRSGFGVYLRCAPPEMYASLTMDQAKNAAKKLNEHARLVEMLQRCEPFVRFAEEPLYPELKVLLAEVEKTP